MSKYSIFFKTFLFLYAFIRLFSISISIFIVLIFFSNLLTPIEKPIKKTIYESINLENDNDKLKEFLSRDRFLFYKDDIDWIHKNSVLSINQYSKLLQLIDEKNKNQLESIKPISYDKVYINGINIKGLILFMFGFIMTYIDVVVILSLIRVGYYRKPRSSVLLSLVLPILDLMDYHESIKQIKRRVTNNPVSVMKTFKNIN